MMQIAKQNDASSCCEFTAVNVVVVVRPIPFSWNSITFTTTVGPNGEMEDQRL